MSLSGAQIWFSHLCWILSLFESMVTHSLLHLSMKPTFPVAISAVRRLGETKVLHILPSEQIKYLWRLTQVVTQGDHWLLPESADVFTGILTTVSLLQVWGVVSHTWWARSFVLYLHGITPFWKPLAIISSTQRPKGTHISWVLNCHKNSKAEASLGRAHCSRVYSWYQQGSCHVLHPNVHQELHNCSSPRADTAYDPLADGYLGNSEAHLQVCDHTPSFIPSAWNTRRGEDCGVPVGTDRAVSFLCQVLRCTCTHDENVDKTSWRTLVTGK